MLEIICKNVFEIITLPNNLVLACRFKYHNLVFYAVCLICEMFFSGKIWLVNHKSLNQTLFNLFINIFRSISAVTAIE